jgi:hypothetical protein
MFRYEGRFLKDRRIVVVCDECLKMEESEKGRSVLQKKRKKKEPISLTHEFDPFFSTPLTQPIFVFLRPNCHGYAGLLLAPPYICCF